MAIFGQFTTILTMTRSPPMAPCVSTSDGTWRCMEEHAEVKSLLIVVRGESRNTVQVSELKNPNTFFFFRI